MQFLQDWMSVTVVNRGDSNVFEEGVGWWFGHFFQILVQSIWQNGGKIWCPQVFLFFLVAWLYARDLVDQNFERRFDFSTLGPPWSIKKLQRWQCRCLRPWWNCSITPNAGVNVPPMWVWIQRYGARWQPEIRRENPVVVGSLYIYPLFNRVLCIPGG